MAGKAGEQKTAVSVRYEPEFAEVVMRFLYAL